MKKIILTLLIVATLLTASCGQKEKNNSEAKEPETETVDMTIEFKYQFDDTFKIYYSTVANGPIDGSLMMTQVIHPSKEFQKVSFVFPLGVYPRNIRFDPGSNQAADLIEIKCIKIEQGQNVIDNSDWINTINWSPNGSLAFDEKAKNYKIEPVTGTKVPTFMANVFIIEKLNKYFLNK